MLRSRTRGTSGPPGFTPTSSEDADACFVQLFIRAISSSGRRRPKHIGTVEPAQQFKPGQGWTREVALPGPQRVFRILARPFRESAEVARHANGIRRWRDQKFSWRWGRFCLGPGQGALRRQQSGLAGNSFRCRPRRIRCCGGGRCSAFDRDSGAGKRNDCDRTGIGLSDWSGRSQWLCFRRRRTSFPAHRKGGFE